MKILFINRDTSNTVYGGDTVQMNYTAKALRKLGVEVDINVAFDTKDYSAYDLIHFFNITRPDNILFHMSKAKIPFVVSTILTDYSFYKEVSSKFRMIAYFFGVDGIEYFKSISKYIFGKEKIRHKRYIFLGQYRSIKKILSTAKYLLPNSENEYQRIQKRYGGDYPFQIIPNGVELDWIVENKIMRKPKTVICVARIEPLKNQLNLIKALNNSGFSLTILGKPSPNHKNYYQQCVNEAAHNVRFIESVSEQDLVSLYAESEIHILPSWFETTGLSSLEAAYFGCKIVVSEKGDVFDYFSGMAEFCKPDDVKSIYKAIEKAHLKEYSNMLRNKIIQEYNWNVAAQKTFAVYNKILGFKE
ncbi:glycosyltransferase family 4 protein [Chryseobacterium sp. EO14]|uniref:glycosyltransferase family 4 protein n=1 Tax=Chryseobacterium sp. EO14 TaxID=2950551 RepID=UPI00210D60B6|nr:glycosyltransferase family 4 protein [Chryseobacterium sp. EO14]MCQ4142446.1 glycosyltransferase family 4 protein [Chryseobacterium sp. EO14]